MTSFFELERVLDYPRLNFSKIQKQRFLELLMELATVVETTIRVDVIKDDSEGNKILECALEAKADYIVSGDEHLLKLKKNGGIKIGCN